MKKKTIHDSIKTKKNINIIIFDDDEVINDENDENWIIKKTYEKNKNEERKKDKKKNEKKRRKKNERKKRRKKNKSKMNVKSHNLLKSDIRL